MDQDPSDATLPSWADRVSSETLSALCADDEGQALEFKEKIPPQLHDLGKTIAAFSSSNDGTILLGVANDGDIKGLQGCEHRHERDKIQQLVMSAAQAVRPPASVRVSWAINDSRVVCVVAVKRGLEPIYYSNERPIIRMGNRSRPAEPDEVAQAFQRKLRPEIKTADLASTRDITRRLRIVLKAMNQDRAEPITVSDLAAAMELRAPSELDTVIAGHRDPTFEMLRRFCERFAVNNEWLTAGRGAPFASQIEHRHAPEDYIELFEKRRFEVVYAVRSSSAHGEAFFIGQTDALNFQLFPEVWHVSSHVGATGASDLLSLYRVFERWKRNGNPYLVVGRHLPLPLARSLWEGEAYPGVVQELRSSDWWMDLTDLEYRWTSRDASAAAYGGGFVRAQDFIRAQLEGKPLPY